MLTTKERIKIVEDKIRFLGQQRQELRQKYRENMELISREVKPNGHVTIISSIPLNKRDTIEYEMRLCAIQAISLQNELRRLYTEEEGS